MITGKKKQKISPELLQRIKEKVNIIEVVGEHVVLRKAGANYVGLCPFHSERSPSFSVTENKQLFHCYGCKKGGDVVTFVMELHGLGFPEAIEELAERGKVALPKDWEGEDSSDPETQKRRAEEREKTQTAYKLNRFVALFYHQQLSSSAVASQYFRKRGVDEELIRNFYAGAAQASWDSLASFLVAKKAPVEVAVSLGLIRPSPKSAPAGGVGYFDLFRNRAMFPILDLRGKVVGFGGRTLPGGESGKDEGPKYMNSPESPLFHKSKIAFGLFQAQKYIREKDEVVIVEGYFDVMALHAAGFRNVVATCGTALTPEHLGLFRKFASKITILFDGDHAGISATEQAMELGLTKGHILYGATLPEGLDPDEILFDQDSGQPMPGGLEKMTEILAHARPLLDVRMEEAVRDSERDAEGRTQAIKRVAAWMAKFSDAVGREVRLLDFQKKLGIDRALLTAASPELSKLVLAEPAVRAPQARPQPVSRPQPTSRPQPKNPSAFHSAPISPGPGANGGPPPGYSDEPPPFAASFNEGPPGPLPGSGQSQSRPMPRAASSQNRARARQNDTVEKLSEPDRIILWALITDAREREKVLEIGRKLPPEVTIAGLFDYVPARVFLTQFLDQKGDFGSPEGGLTRFVPPDLDIQLRSVLTEAATSPKSPFTTEELQDALDHAFRKCWARFSQHIKARMHDAEAKKDAGLHEQLSKEYLDVQRKMKEFTSFYDEA